MKKRITIIIAIFLLLALADSQEKKQEDYSFSWFMQAYNKYYINQLETKTAYQNYQNNLAEVLHHNAKPNTTYKKGINQFADKKAIQFISSNSLETPNIQIYNHNESANWKPPAFPPIDWVARGKVTPVKHQRQCRGCYAFATVAALESAILIAEGKVTDLSEQQVIDCSANSGCVSGGISPSYRYMMNTSIVSERDYPQNPNLTYQNYYNPYVKKNHCKNQNNFIRIGKYLFKTNHTSYKIKNYVDVKNCVELQKALQISPVTVLVNADNWLLYSEGIFADCNGFNTTQNILAHAVLLVGATKDYWKIKNSWGEGWGEDGYIRLARGNTCGICEYPSYLILK